MRKPYAESCDENGPHILKILELILERPCELLEIGSGTGQHAVMFGQEMPDVTWYTSDLRENHDGIRTWIEESGLDNLVLPIQLDVSVGPWPKKAFDVVFTANTAHIMSAEAVMGMFSGVARVLKPGAVFILYGPFMYGGRHTSLSNERFDHWLRSIEPHRGVRDVEWLKELAEPLGMRLEEDIPMPANNRILVWRGSI